MKLLSRGRIPDPHRIVRGGGPGGGGRTATASYDNTVRIWDTTSGKELHKILQGNTHVTRPAYRPDGKLLASATWDGTVKVWDATTFKEPRTIKPPGAVYGVAFSPDGKQVVSVSVKSKRAKKTNPLEGTGRLIVWNLETSEKVCELEGHTNHVLVGVHGLDLP